MKNKAKEKNNALVEHVVDSDMSNVLIDAFNRYAKEVITDRAIPDARDGLKPVQRRIIFDMYDQGYRSVKPTVKCATIVGHVMGHYHPHGDSSIYDALVHLSQSWKMEAPLVTFQGNNGSIDDDPAAANRYTEAKLSELSDYLCLDLEKNTVKMVPTFDDKSLEPTVLPARFPNLLVNGTSGIAVGSATYIPPHNLGEVITAAIYRIRHKRCQLDDIIKIIPAPDFPTGGIIDDVKAIRSLYESGSGSFYLYAKAYVDEGENTIVISEIPYGTVKKDFVANLAKRKKTDNLDNIEEIIDESARDDIKIVLQIKNGASPYDILNYLQSKGMLRSTIACNFLAIDHGHPRSMPLLDLLDSFLDHQRDVSRKAFDFDLKTAKDRLEIVDGYRKCYSLLNEIIEKIRKCSGKEGVKNMLKADYSFTERQAEAIAMMPLYRLSNTDIVALNQEYDSLTKNVIPQLEELLSNPDKLDESIVAILTEIRKKFSIARKTQILENKQSFDSVDTTKLIAKEDVYICCTYDGYAKKTSVKSYQASMKNATEQDPFNLPKMKPGDHLVYSGLADTHQGLLLFTNTGNYAYVPVYMLTDLKWKEEGKHLNNIIALKAEERIVKAFLVDEFKKGINVVLLTKENKIKRTSLEEFVQTTITKRPIRACKMGSKSDSLVDVTMTTGNSDVIVVDNLGRCSRFHESEIPLVSTGAIGVKAYSAGIENAPLVSVLSLSSKEVSLLLVISSNRGARLIKSSDIETSTRLGPKANLIKVLKKNPWNIVTVEKFTRVKGKKSFASVTTVESSVTCDIDSLSPIALGAEMRENLSSLGKNIIIGYNEFGEVINKDTLVEEPVVQKIERVKVKADDVDTQLNLFDLFEREQNK